MAKKGGKGGRGGAIPDQKSRTERPATRRRIFVLCRVLFWIGCYLNSVITPAKFLNVLVEPHPGFRVVGRRMYDYAHQFCESLDPQLVNLSLADAVDYIADLGYLADDTLDRDVEILIRPDAIAGPIDCKKMCVMLAAWAIRNDCPFRFLAVAEYDQTCDGVVDDQDIHHVVTLIEYRGETYMVDPTRRHDAQIPLYAEVL